MGDQQNKSQDKGVGAAAGAQGQGNQPAQGRENQPNTGQTGQGNQPAGQTGEGARGYDDKQQGKNPGGQGMQDVRLDNPSNQDR